ncbi:MAG: phosphoglucomutase/phosphomannomutase family protein [Candidatus Helarchaeota archaeon]
MVKIEFGTDGWRSIMDDENFNIKNVEIVGKAISNYLLKEGLNSKPIIIGYDTRRNSDIFGEVIARILIRDGIPVRLTVSDVPTPVVAYLILYFETGGGVMITASHNPPNYNGIKFIPYYASPAMPDITNKLMDEIQKIQTNNFVIEKYKGNLKNSPLFHEINPVDLYIDNILNKLDVNKIRAKNYIVSIDPLFGTARTYLEPILKKLNCKVFGIHTQKDPNFGGKMPNPSPELLKELRDLVLEHSADIGMACDGDGDRSGIIDDKGNFIDANYLFGLLFKYYIDKGFRGDVVRTVSTTHLIDRIANDYNLKVYETPVGSKYIGQYMREKKLLIGGESSGGLMFHDHIPEKDGIFSDMKVLEMMSYYQKKLSDLYQNLIDTYGEIFFKQINVECPDELKDKVLNNLGSILPNTFTGLKVIKKSEIDGFKFILEDNSWILIRKSGTEPLLRLYCESTTLNLLQKLVSEGKQLLISAQQ